MSDKIELTEEQARRLISNIWADHVNYDKSIQLLRGAGYIKQSPVEKAEEVYNIYKQGVEKYGAENYGLGDENVDKLFNALLYLKKQLEEKNNA